MKIRISPDISYEGPSLLGLATLDLATLAQTAGALCIIGVHTVREAGRVAGIIIIPTGTAWRSLWMLLKEHPDVMSAKG